MNVEARLRERVGAAAGKLHTGRSRNDQVATDLSLYLRDAARATRAGLHDLQEVLLVRAREHLDTVLPGYTHLQRAQPVRLAHHWLAFVEMFGRDAQRLRDLESRLSLSPLGSGALAGSTLPLDRDDTARALGFAGPARNSMDAVASRDAALEFLAAGAIAQVHLSRLAEELVIWSTAEFAFIELADAYSTGSSLMPQKKNPDVPELVRGKAGRVIGNLVALLTVLKGLPLTYNRDLQEDKEPIFDTARTLRDSLEVMAGALATLRVNEARMREAASDPMLLAPTSRRRSCARACRSARRTRRSAASSRTASRRTPTCARSRARTCARSTRRSRPAPASCSRSSARSRVARCRARPRARASPRRSTLPTRSSPPRAERWSRRDEQVSRSEPKASEVHQGALALLMLGAALAACGHYGPPVRASRAKSEATANAPAPGPTPTPLRSRRRVKSRRRMSELRFTKMHGAGNDFVVLDGRARRAAADRIGRGTAVRPPSRHWRRSAAGRAAEHERRLPHGDLERRRSQVEMCANGIRAFYKYLRDRGHTDRAEIGVETLSGVVRPRWAGADRVTVDMGPPDPRAREDPHHAGRGRRTRARRAARAAGESLRVSSVSMGNPHAVIYVDDVERAPVERLGPRDRAPRRVPEPRQRRVRARARSRPDLPAHLGARRRRDARVRERRLRRRRSIHVARRGRAGGPDRAARRRARDLVARRRRARGDDRARGRSLHRRDRDLGARDVRGSADGARDAVPRRRDRRVRAARARRAADRGRCRRARAVRIDGRVGDALARGAPPRGRDRRARDARPRPVVAGTGSNNTREAVELTLYAKEAGADGALLISPYYNKPTQEGLFLHYAEIARRTAFPLVLYNVPSRTSSNMLPTTVARLADLEQVVGIKEACGNLAQISEVIDRCPGDFSVLSGDDALTLPILAVGGKGVVCTTSNVAPSEMVLARAVVPIRRPGRGAPLPPAPAAIVRRAVQRDESDPVKAALQLIGAIGPEIRLPLTPLTAPNRERLQVVLKELGLVG
jgi:4-hydroxy-tetrahydrodipicolinate synthase